MTERGEDTRRRKNDVKKHRKRVNYEANVPRCATCKFYNPTMKGDKTLIPSWCKRNKFKVHCQGCCDFWESKNGERFIKSE